MAAIQADLDNTQELEGIRNEASFRASIKNATSLNKCSGHTGVPSRDGRLFLSTIKMFLSQIYLYEITYSDTVEGVVVVVVILDDLQQQRLRRLVTIGCSQRVHG